MLFLTHYSTRSRNNKGFFIDDGSTPIISLPRRSVRPLCTKLQINSVKRPANASFPEKRAKKEASLRMPRQCNMMSDQLYF